MTRKTKKQKFASVIIGAKYTESFPIRTPTTQSETKWRPKLIRAKTTKIIHKYVNGKNDAATETQIVCFDGNDELVEFLGLNTFS